MKKTLLFLVIFLPLITFSQSQVVEKFYNSYEDADQVNSVSLSTGILQLTASGTDDDRNLLEKISRLRMLIMSDDNLVSAKEYKSFRKNLKKDHFGELMNIREKGTNVDIFFREEGDFITDVLLLVNEEDNFVMLSLEGLFKFSDLNDLELDFEGGEHLKKIPEKKEQIDRA